MAGSVASEAIEYHGEPRRRKRWVAVVATFVCPGLGFMYVGQLLKGITINLLFLLMLETFVIVFSILKFFPLLPFLVLVASWLIFSSFAARSVLAHIENESPYVLKGYNHWTVYTVVFLLTYMVPIYATGHFLSQYLLSFDEVQTAAMYPTIQSGDTVLVDRSAYRNRAPRRGDLVAVRLDGKEDLRILRVVAVENDMVRIEGETVFVNGKPLERYRLEEETVEVASFEQEGDLLAMVEDNNGNRYVISVSPKAFSAHTMPPQKLDANQFFVLADNRSQIPADGTRVRIRDSRNFGPVSIDAIEGKPLYIAWSEEPSTNRTRWQRIGLRTQ